MKKQKYPFVFDWRDLWGDDLGKRTWLPDEDDVPQVTVSDDGHAIVPCKGVKGGSVIMDAWVWARYIERGFSPHLAYRGDTVLTVHDGENTPTAPILVCGLPNYEGVTAGTHRIQYLERDWHGQKTDLRLSALGMQKGKKGGPPPAVAIRRPPVGIGVRVNPDHIRTPRHPSQYVPKGFEEIFGIGPKVDIDANPQGPDLTSDDVEYYHSSYHGTEANRYWSEESGWDMHEPVIGKRLTVADIQAYRKAIRVTYEPMTPEQKAAKQHQRDERYVRRMVPQVIKQQHKRQMAELNKPRKRWAVDRQKKQPTTYVKNGKTYFHAYYVNGQRVVPIQNKYGRWVPWPEYQLRRKQDLLLRMFYVEDGKFRCIPHRKRDPFPSKLTFRKRGLIFAIS